MIMSTGTLAKPVVSFSRKGTYEKRILELSISAKKVFSPEKEDVDRNVSSSFEETSSPVLKDNSKEHKLLDSDRLSKEAQKEEESEWILRASEGDVDAFKNLFDRYYMRLRSVAYGILSNEEDAADVCQEAFFKAYRNLATFRGQSSFYTWMYRIVYNLCIDLGRKSSRKREIPTAEASVFEHGATRPYSEYLMPLPSSPEENAYNGELAEGIREAMQELSPAHRSVISLRELDGMSYEEISVSLGCSVGTVMSRLFHARKKLCASLERIIGDLPFREKPLKRENQ
jgi:RNA polymerase sigma-70 factor (ECF subfamily)